MEFRYRPGKTHANAGTLSRVQTTDIPAPAHQFLKKSSTGEMSAFSRYRKAITKGHSPGRNDTEGHSTESMSGALAEVIDLNLVDNQRTD
jgi:ATP:corrinoid adenosyltransferase